MMNPFRATCLAAFFAALALGVSALLGAICASAATDPARAWDFFNLFAACSWIGGFAGGLLLEARR